MTVKHLKKIIQDIPDNALITITGEDSDGILVEEFASFIKYDEEINQLYISY
ncbi:MAG: hypothetical protein RL736_623 [Pseudomonadota bacterium]|jgi:predicted amino acid-binding ACT domain protein